MDPNSPIIPPWASADLRVDATGVIAYEPAALPDPKADCFRPSDAAMAQSELGTFDPWARELSPTGSYPGGSEIPASEAEQAADGFVGLPAGKITVPIAAPSPAGGNPFLSRGEGPGDDFTGAAS